MAKRITRTEIDDELCRRIVEKNPNAVGQMIHNVMRAYFCGIMKKAKPEASDDYMDSVLADFFVFLFSPTTSGDYRLRNLRPGQEARVYLGRTFNNFFIDNYLNKKATNTPLEEGRTADNNDQGDEFPGDETDADPADLEQRVRVEDAQLLALIHALAKARSFTPEQRYILLTYLVAKRFDMPGVVLNLDSKLHQELPHRTAPSIYSIYDRKLKDLRKIARAKLKELLKNQ